jgi:hypothetical protein
MIDSRLEDHLVGVELQIVELVERRERAALQGRPDDAAAIQAELDALYAEMARTADRLAGTA